MGLARRRAAWWFSKGLCHAHGPFTLEPARGTMTFMRRISERRMKRWLERKTRAARRGRRYGLCAMAIPAPEVEGGKEWVAGESIPYAAHVLGWASVLVPLMMPITRISEDYPWWRLRWNRLSRDELSLHARFEMRRAAEARENENEREALDLEIADFLMHKALRRVSTSGRGIARDGSAVAWQTATVGGER